MDGGNGKKRKRKSAGKTEKSRKTTSEDESADEDEESESDSKVVKLDIRKKVEKGNQTKKIISRKKKKVEFADDD